MKQYYYPIITIILLMIFYLGFPDPDKTSIGKKSRKFNKTDYIAVSIITFIFGIVDFIGLGDISDPETFVLMPENTAYVEFSDEAAINKIVLYTGVGSGTYMVDFSEDNYNWFNVGQFSQDSATVLKWNYIVPEYDYSNVKYARIYGSGDAYLGEVGFLDDSDNTISYLTNIHELNDEQDQIRLKQTFLNSSYFDEIYHARTAWEQLNHVYPYEVSHPPLGKIIISIGITIFGMNPFGWRFSGTLFGVMMLPVIYVFSKKMFSSTRVSICTTLLTATDFMHFVQTRIATIDTYAVFFILLMYLFMYDYIKQGKNRYLALSGIFFGIGAACKWTCIYAGAGLAIIWLVYRIKKLDQGIKPLMKNIGFCLVFFIFIPVMIYCLSYYPYAAPRNIEPVFSKEYYSMIIDNQRFMFNYHSGLVAEHPYSSRWYQWLFNIRPILYYLQNNPDGTRQSFGAFLNPVLCWGGIIAIVILMYYSIIKREKKALFLITAYFSQLIPWVFVSRLTFEYHYFPCSVFLALSFGYIFRIMERGNKKYKWYIYSLTAMSAALFILFYPVLSGIPIKESVQSTFLSWLPTWPF